MQSNLQSDPKDSLIKSSLRKRLKKRVIIGTCIEDFYSPSVCKLLGRAGLDWVLLEVEHIQINPETMLHLLDAANDVGLGVVVKLPELSRNWICRSLDAGAAGVALPWTETKKQAEELVCWAKYPPIGKRAIYFGANTDYLYQEPSKYITAANESILTMALIESVEGVRNIDEITSVSYLDVIMVAPYDLSVNLGVPGKFNHPKFLDAVEKVMKASKTHGVVPGLYVDDPESARQWISKGVKCILCSTDRVLLQKAAETLAGNLLEALKKL